MLCYAFYYKEFLYFPKVSVQVTNLLYTLLENVDKCISIRETFILQNTLFYQK